MHTRRGIEVVITGLTRNHVCIWVVVPPKTAEKPWFCWIFARLMIFLTSLSNGISKKLNIDCFPRFRGWTYTERYRSGHNGADSKSVWRQRHMGSNPILSANGTLENPVFSRVFSIRWKFFRFYFLCFCQFFEPILCSFSPVNIRIKNRQIPHEIRLFKVCILFAALERFPSDKKSPNFKTPGCGQPHQKSCVVFTG